MYNGFDKRIAYTVNIVYIIIVIELSLFIDE